MKGCNRCACGAGFGHVVLLCSIHARTEKLLDALAKLHDNAASAGSGQMSAGFVLSTIRAALTADVSERAPEAEG